MKLSTPLTLRETAKIIHAEFDGDPDFLVYGFNEIHKVEQGDLSFADHPKYYKKVIQSAATTILINQRVEKPDEKALIFSDDPFRDYNILTSTFSSFEKCDRTISLKAIIGKNTIIQPNAFIGNNVVIGDNCIIHANVSIYDGAIIGNNVIIHSNTVIGADAFYFKKRPTGYDKLLSCGNVIIEDDVEIGANCAIDKGVSGSTVIGRGTKMDNLIQIGHDTMIGKNCLFVSQVGVAGACIIEDNVTLWGQVGIQQGLTIGKGASVLGQSGIGRSIEPGKVFFGSPAIEAKEKMKELAYLKRLQELFNNNQDKA